jgi:hypothetical protein
MKAFSRTELSLLLVSALLAVALGLRSSDYKKQREFTQSWKRRAEWPATGLLLPRIEGRTLAGEKRPVTDSAGVGTLLFVLSSTCPYCEANHSAWKSLDSLSTRTGVRVVWFALDSLQSAIAYADTADVGEEKLVFADDMRSVLAARIRGVPLTLLVDSTGRVQFVHGGRLGKTEIDSLGKLTSYPR